MPHMAVLLTGKPPTMHWMMLHSYRAKLVPNRVPESTCASEREPYLPRPGLGGQIKAAFALFC